MSRRERRSVTAPVEVGDMHMSSKSKKGKIVNTFKNVCPPPEQKAEEKQAEVAALFEQTEHYRPTEPHWYLSLIGVGALHRNKGRGAALLEHRLRQCDREHLPAYLWSSNPLNTTLYQRHGFEIAGTIRVGSSPSIYPMLRSAR